MRKIILLFLAMLYLAGCTTTLYQVRAENTKRLTKLSVGMVKDKVLHIMGTKEITVCNDWGDKIGVISNPYKTEALKYDNRVFEVLYYYTDIMHSDAMITEQELTPIVFENGKLIGFGWPFFNGIKRQDEIPR